MDAQGASCSDQATGGFQLGASDWLNDKDEAEQEPAAAAEASGDDIEDAERDLAACWAQEPSALLPAADADALDAAAENADPPQPPSPPPAARPPVAQASEGVVDLTATTDEEEDDDDQQDDEDAQGEQAEVTTRMWSSSRRSRGRPRRLPPRLPYQFSEAQRRRQPQRTHCDSRRTGRPSLPRQETSAGTKASWTIYLPKSSSCGSPRRRQWRHRRTPGDGAKNG